MKTKILADFQIYISVPLRWTLPYYSLKKLYYLNFVKTSCFVKLNESRYKQCGVAPQFSTEQNLRKKILRKDKY